MYPQGSHVRLLRPALGVPKGTVGQVLGAYRREQTTYVVKFPTAEREVLAEDLELAAITPRAEPLAHE